MKKIPKTTLCCIDCLNHELAIRALRLSTAACSFERVLFLTDREFALDGIETVRIPKLDSRDAYSGFILRSLADYIDTEFALLIQWDGYVANPRAWRDDFLQYDYIGAVWGQHKDAFRVGNGGFSLRSKKLLQATRQLPSEAEPLNEDELICRKQRPWLEREFGIRFSPEDAAERFSFELTYPKALPFGFHGLFNAWLILAPDEVMDYVAALPPNVVASQQFFRLGTNYRDLRQFRFAETIFRRILALQPEHPDAKRQLEALAKPPLPARAIGRNEPCPCNSGQRYKNCCGKDPLAVVARGATRAEDIDWLLRVGMQHHQQGHTVHAAAIYRLILAEHPDHAIARQYLGVAAYQGGDHEPALALIESAIALRPEIPDFHNNLGLVFQAQGNLQRAIECYRRALELNPKYVEAYNNMGLALDADGRAAEAIPYFEHAIALQPNFAQAHWNLAISLLVTGELLRGWQEYEWRLKTPELAGTQTRFAQPVWQGDELAGKTILLEAEQGFGDSIQFVRYAPLIAARGGRVIVECRPGLKRLFESVAGVEQVVDRGEPLPAFDVRCAQLSLPARFGTVDETVPAHVPYLSVRPALAAHWRARMPDTGARLRIGLAWAGNPDHKNDRNRSIPYERFATLLGAGEAAFFSLQKGVDSSRPHDAPTPQGLTDLTPQIGDFADMAALIANLDLVISVDTSLAHLAGATGKPVWVLLPFAPDWRWQLEREDSPWYPSMRLFRQRRRGDWDDVLARVLHALREFQVNPR